ncbi:MAG: leucyl aminopeptidase [Proteobacteria bacterium]|nr:leucyl aminopeptidase [Pseudomonadota bacterium]
MDIQFSKITTPVTGAVVFGIGEKLVLPPKAVELDKKTNGALTKAIEAADFKGKKGKFLPIYATIDLPLDMVILVGLGKADELEESALQALGGSIATYLNNQRVQNAAVIVEDTGSKKLKPSEVAAQMAYGARLKTYRFYKYFTKLEDDKKQTLKKLNFMLEEPEKANTAFKPLDKIADGVIFARDLVSEPPNVLYPESYAKRCQELKKLGVKVEVLGEKEMKKLGMGSLLGVGQGSERDSQLVVMSWNGAPKSPDKAPLAFVGKGVTFDTGGISIKPAGGMEDMKYDMGGSAAVVGLIAALAGRKAKVNVVGVIGLVENMPDGNAQRPSDVVTSMSGQTIEVLNTDAEGRLVLADALWYTQQRFKPQFMVNLATLTGAITVALGSLYAGLFSNNDELSKRLTEAGEKTGEKLWRFPISPIGEGYDKQINSKTADMQNIGNAKGAGSITAAQFLQRFVNGVPWAHLDIAGVAWATKDLDVVPEGATAFGVRLLERLVADYYEQ